MKRKMALRLAAARVAEDIEPGVLASKPAFLIKADNVTVAILVATAQKRQDIGLPVSHAAPAHPLGRLAKPSRRVAPKMRLAPALAALPLVVAPFPGRTRLAHKQLLVGQANHPTMAVDRALERQN